MRESQVTVECVKFMRANGWRPRRNHVGTFYTRSGAAIPMGEKGEADWAFLKPACVVFVEFKRPGEEPEKHQLEWLAKMRYLGYRAGWCDSLAGLKVLLAKWSLL